MSIVLFESVQSARFTYRCDKCHQQIEAGEEYRRWLWRLSDFSLHVMHEHLDCEPDHPPHDEDRLRLFDDYRMPLAA